ncbi:oligosaccharide flippase family protein [Flavobacterium sp. PLA-1-15]|uniref:oligosaccharide flippase family protein n=1 Tax=Flavobacterium sp. PLA-1-15 TaxID=3380533 RepID=UPI003B75E3CB
MKERLLQIIKNEKKINFLIYGFGQSFNLLSPLIIAPFIVGICREEGLGKVGLGFAMSLFLILLVDYAFDVKGTKQVSENRFDKASLGKILSVAIFTKLSLFSIAFLIALLAIHFIPFLHKEKQLYLLSLTIVFAQVFNPIWFLQGLEKFRTLSILNIFSKTVYVLLVFGFIKESNDYIFSNFFLGVSSLFFNVIGIIIINRKYNIKIKLPSLQAVITIIKTDFTFCMSQLFLSARQLSPLVLTGYFLGFSVAGQYKIIEQVITLFRTYTQVLLKFFYPSLCYKFVSDKFGAFLYWRKYTFFNFLLISLVLIFAYIFAERILLFFNLDSAYLTNLLPVFRLSLIVSLLMSFSLPLEQFVLVLAKTKKYIMITIFVTIVNVLLLLLFINYYELYAVIFAMILSEILFISLYFNGSFKNLKK